VQCDTETNDTAIQTRIYHWSLQTGALAGALALLGSRAINSSTIVPVNNTPSDITGGPLTASVRVRSVDCEIDYWYT